MYCPRCDVETNDNFCEICGGATVKNKDNNSISPKENNSEKIKRKFEISDLVSLLKKIRIVLISSVIILGGIIGYTTLQEQNTPKKTVDKFYDYIVEKDYDNAYKMLIGTDNDFMTKELFKISMEQNNIKSYSIKEYNSNEFKQVFSSDNLQSTNMQDLGSMFIVQADNTTYPISVINNGSKLIFFKDYKINASNLSTKWQIVSSKGARILINSNESQFEREENPTNLSFNQEYKPITVTYKANKIFNGTYNVTAKMDGAEDINKDNVQAGTNLVLRFKPTESTLEDLKNKGKTFIELYYSNASEDRYKSIITEDSDALSKIKESFGNNSYSDNLQHKVESFQVEKAQIDDVDHACLTIKGSVYYEDISMVQFGGEKQIINEQYSTEIYFEKVNGSWLICDTAYINQ